MWHTKWLAVVHDVCCHPVAVEADFVCAHRKRVQRVVVVAAAAFVLQVHKDGSGIWVVTCKDRRCEKNACCVVFPFCRMTNVVEQRYKNDGIWITFGTFSYCLMILPLSNGRFFRLQKRALFCSLKNFAL